MTNGSRKRTQRADSKVHCHPFVEHAAYFNHRHQTVDLCNTQDRTETAHTITTNSQSCSKTHAQAHKIANALQAMPRKTRDWAIRRRTRDLLSSDEPPCPATACALQRLAHDNSCQKARGDCSIPNPASRCRYLSTTSRLTGKRTTPHCYDVRTACPYARAREMPRHMYFQLPFTDERIYLLLCSDLDDSGRKLPKWSH